jgi:hypothetical protein
MSILKPLNWTGLITLPASVYFGNNYYFIIHFSKELLCMDYYFLSFTITSGSGTSTNYCVYKHFGASGNGPKRYGTNVCKNSLVSKTDEAVEMLSMGNSR